MKKKILFMIHDLGQGGAEKVLVNLVNHMDTSRFDITVLALFGGGVNERHLRPEIKYRFVFSRTFPGNSRIMKLFSPVLLHKWLIKGEYDIEISYLEGPTARIISGCRNPDTKLVTWIHCTMCSPEDVAASFRNKKEAETCYNAMDELVFVSEGVRHGFLENCRYEGSTEVLYNTMESNKILKMSQENVDKICKDKINLIAVGTLKPVKGFDRLIRIVKRLCKEGYPIHLYILGIGPQQRELEQLVREHRLTDIVSLLGYQTNPYKYMSKCSLFICSSFSEGFSTATVEALILGIPVCTVEVSGMREILGTNSEFGLITENTEEALCQGIRKMIDHPEILESYKDKAEIRGKIFYTSGTVKAVEEFLQSLLQNK